jgi:hypothetical protein
MAPGKGNKDTSLLLPFQAGRQLIKKVRILRAGPVRFLNVLPAVRWPESQRVFHIIRFSMPLFRAEGEHREAIMFL